MWELEPPVSSNWLEFEAKNKLRPVEFLREAVSSCDVAVVVVGNMEAGVVVVVEMISGSEEFDTS